MGLVYFSSFLTPFHVTHITFLLIGDCHITTRDYQGKRVNLPDRSSNQGNPSKLFSEISLKTAEKVILLLVRSAGQENSLRSSLLSLAQQNLLTELLESLPRHVTRTRCLARCLTASSTPLKLSPSLSALPNSQSCTKTSPEGHSSVFECQVNN